MSPCGYRLDPVHWLLSGSSAEEIFPYSGATGDGRAVGKVKIVFIIYVNI